MERYLTSLLYSYHEYYGRDIIKRNMKNADKDYNMMNFSVKENIDASRVVAMEVRLTKECLKTHMPFSWCGSVVDH